MFVSYFSSVDTATETVCCLWKSTAAVEEMTHVVVVNCYRGRSTSQVPIQVNA